MSVNPLTLLLEFILLPFRTILNYFLSIKYETLVPANCVVVITGCDTGFGNASAKQLGKLGFVVVAACLTKEGVEDMLKNQIRPVLCDITKPEDIQTLKKAVDEILTTRVNCKLWAVINNAGIASGAYIDMIDMKLFRKVMEVNFFAAVKVIQTFLPAMKKCKNARIINLCSMAGVGGFPTGSAYCSSKHALEGLLKCIRQELHPWNLHVVNINPGFMRTPIITKGPQESISFMQSLPTELTDQYQREAVDSLQAMIERLVEEPQLVVDAILRAVQVAKPPSNLYPGYQAKGMIWLQWMFPAVYRDTIDEVKNRLLKSGPYPEVVLRMQQGEGGEGNASWNGSKNGKKEQ